MRRGVSARLRRHFRGLYSGLTARARTALSWTVLFAVRGLVYSADLDKHDSDLLVSRRDALSLLLHLFHALEDQGELKPYKLPAFRQSKNMLPAVVERLFKVTEMVARLLAQSVRRKHVLAAVNVVMVDLYEASETSMGKAIAFIASDMGRMMRWRNSGFGSLFVARDQMAVLRYVTAGIDLLT